ncbi:7 transmembrane receptor [Ditylenchus destructor]|nr:7 transmembrane receptor [Ditylenchus destructor]
MERFFAIVFPLQHMRYHHINRLMLVAIFLLPMQLWTIYFELLPYIEPYDYSLMDKDACRHRGVLYFIKVNIPFYISLVILPLLSAICVNSIIGIRLRRRPKVQRNSTPVATSECRSNSDDNHRILWILPLVYIVLTTPNVVMHFVKEFYTDMYADKKYTPISIVYNIFYQVFELEFVFNWFFYAMASSTFRKAFITFWFSKFRRIRFAVTGVSNNDVATSLSPNVGKFARRNTQETHL